MNTITSSNSTLANALLSLSTQTQPADDSSTGSEVDLAALNQDTLQLSGSSASQITIQQQVIAAQNRSSAITSNDEALAASLAAVAALAGNPASALSSYSNPSSANVLGLLDS